MFDYFNPYRIFKINSTLQKIVFFCFIIVLSIGLVEALFLSPEDYLQKDSVRIMYVHVPAAWISLGIFSTIALLSFSVFVFKNNVCQGWYLITCCSCSKCCCSTPKSYCGCG